MPKLDAIALSSDGWNQTRLSHAESVRRPLAVTPGKPTRCLPKAVLGASRLRAGGEGRRRDAVTAPLC